MKRTLFIIVILTGFSTVYSQNYDLIVTTNGDSIACQIDSISTTKIYFKMKVRNNWIQTYFDKNLISDYQLNLIDKKSVVFKPGTSIIGATDTQEHKWHWVHCGVTDINNCTAEEFECLWRNASANHIGGAITIGTGTSFIVAGIVVPLLPHDPRDWGPAFGGIILISAGVIVGLIGLPILITGRNRKAELRETSNYKNLNLGSLNISPSIGLNQINNSQYYGLSLSLNF